MSERWYKNDPPGYSIMTAEDVILLDRKDGHDTRSATAAYTEFVLDEVEYWRDQGWAGYIAPQAHAEDKGVVEAWHWDTENPGMFLEAAYLPQDAPLDQVRSLYNIHRGQGWQYPVVFVFDDTPSQAVIQFLANTRRSPIVILSHYSAPSVLPPEEEEDEEYAWLEDLRKVQSDLEYLENNWKRLRRRRRGLVRQAVAQLFDVIAEIEEEV